MAQPAEYGQQVDNIIEAGPLWQLEEVRKFVEQRVGRLLCEGSIIHDRSLIDVPNEYDFCELASMTDRGTLISLWRNSDVENLEDRYHLSTMDSHTGIETRWTPLGEDEGSQYTVEQHRVQLKLAATPLFGVVGKDTPHLMLTGDGCTWTSEVGKTEVLEPLQHGVRRLMREAGVTQLY